MSQSNNNNARKLPWATTGEFNVRDFYGHSGN